MRIGVAALVVRLQSRMWCQLPALALGLCASVSSLADTTTVTVADGNKATSTTTPVTLRFPITRTGDVGYDAVLSFHTVQNGTAVPGVDFTAENPGSAFLPAGPSATIPVTLAAHSSGGLYKTFGVVVDSATGIGPTPSFGARINFATGTSPTPTAVADINGDGLPDLIVANFGSNTVSVLINTASPGNAPTFSGHQDFATGNGPQSLTIADVNGDGLPDLIVANFGSGQVSVLLNTTARGSATAIFSAHQDFNTLGGAYSVTTADINGDGLPDLIVATNANSTLSVLLNTTTPGSNSASFATHQDFNTAGNPSSVAVADINGDGKPDLIATNFSAGSVSVLLNTTVPGSATAAFSGQQDFTVGAGPFSVVAKDVNGDGLPDLIVANLNDNNISVLLDNTVVGATTAAFAPQQTFAAGFTPDSVIAADVNGDGKPDVITANLNDHDVSVLLNTTAAGAAAPSFATQQTFAAGTTPNSVTAADINGDGKPDLIVANGGDSTVSVLLNTTASSTATLAFATEHTYAAGTVSGSVTTADVNGDGKKDLVVANFNGNNVSVLLNTTAPGAVTPTFAAQHAFAAGTAPSSVTVADVNGDGLLDLIVTNGTSNNVSVLVNATTPGATTPSFAAHQDFTTGTIPQSVVVADINGDGKPDLIVANASSSNVSVLLNTTAPGAAPPTFATHQDFTVGAGPYSVIAADVNGDGRPDVIVANGGDNNVSVLLNSTSPGVATPAFTAQHTFATGATPQSVTTADVNGDGKPDLIVANGGDNDVSVLLNTTAPGAAAPTFAAQQTFNTGASPISVAATDVDGDGKPDLIVANIDANNVSVLLDTTAPGASTPTFAAQQTFATGAGPATVTAIDVNGDGKPDLITANSNANTVSVLLNTQYQVSFAGSPVTGTIVYDGIFQADFE